MIKKKKCDNNSIKFRRAAHHVVCNTLLESSVVAQAVEYGQNRIVLWVRLFLQKDRNELLSALCLFFVVCLFISVPVCLRALQRGTQQRAWLDHWQFRKLSIP